MNDKQITIVVGVVLDELGKILITRRNDPVVPAAHNKWDLVGGKIEFREDPEMAIVREIKEETGIDVAVVGLVPKVFSMVWEDASNEQFQVIIICYKCRKIGGAFRPEMDRKIFEMRFATLDEIKRLDRMPLVVPIIEASNI